MVKQILHMADIMPTQAHSNPLWVLAFDDYPMTSIFAKEKLMKEALAGGYRFIFYHDAYYRLVKWDASGKEIIESVKLLVNKKPSHSSGIRNCDGFLTEKKVYISS